MATSQSIKTQEQSQEWWLSLGHSTALKSWSLGEMSQVPPGSGQILVWWKAQGSNLCLFRGKTQAWLDFFLTRAGFLSLHVICPIVTYLSPADHRGSPSGRERPVCLTYGSSWRQTPPKVRPPPLPAVPKEDLRCLSWNRDLATLLLPFFCIDPSAFNMGECCRPSAQLPASLPNMKAWYPHVPWNVAETSPGNEAKVGLEL